MPSPLSRSVAANIRKSSRDATFIFFGRVEREGASALSQIAAGPKTNIIRIERILKAPDVLRDFNGQEATYLAESATGARSTGVFFTVPVAFGETVGLREVGSIAEVGDVDAVAELITQVGDEMSDEALRADLRGRCRRSWPSCRNQRTAGNGCGAAFRAQSPMAHRAGRSRGGS